MRAFVETGFLRATYPLGRALLESITTGKDVPFNLLHEARRRGQEAGSAVSQGVSDAVYLETGATFPWKIDFDLEA